jgi:hypothetical protein
LAFSVDTAPGSGRNPPRRPRPKKPLAEPSFCRKSGGVSRYKKSFFFPLQNFHFSNAAAQTVSGDISLATNGATTLAATGTAGTYAQVTTDAKGRVTSGTATLPISAGGTGQTTGGGLRNVSSANIMAGSFQVSGGAVTNGFWDQGGGPGQNGIDFNGGEIELRYGGTVLARLYNSPNQFLMFSSIVPAFSQDNVLTLGASGQTFSQVWTHALITLGTSTGAITATGWTNTTGSKCFVNLIGSSSTFTIYDNSGTAWATNASFTRVITVPLQAGGKITSASGLSGTWHVQ